MLGNLAPNFSLWEFVPRIVLKQRGAKAIELLDVRLILSAQQIRNHFGKPVTVNTWRNYKRTGWPKFEFRGFRPRWYKGGSVYSQHYSGRAFDFNVLGYTPAQVRKEIRANRGEFPFINVLESRTSTWIHADIRDPAQTKIRMVRV